MILLLVDTLLRKIALGFITLYQKTLSPDLGIFRWWLQGRICAHNPHCSAYCATCFRRYNFLHALHYCMERVSSCTGGSSVTYDPPYCRVVFYSGASIGVPFLKELAKDKRYELVGVVTNPPAKSGRGMKKKENIIAQTAKEIDKDIPVLTPPSLKKDSKKRADKAEEFHTLLEKIRPDIAIVVAYGKILPKYTLELPHFGTINVHGSILPAYRGASPLQSVFLEDYKAAGATVMKMVEKLDAGPILDTLPIKIKFDWTVKKLIKALKDRAPKFTCNTIWKYIKGNLDLTPQDPAKVSYCSKINKEDGKIDFFKDSLEDIYKRYQAFALWPKIFGKIGEKRVIIEQIRLDKKEYQANKDKPLLSKDGDSYMLHPAVVKLICKPSGKQAMSWDEFKRGYLQ